MPSTPLSLIAELTHRCPLHCVYCSNPLELQARQDEIDTETWKRVIEQAADLGVVQLNLTGGEPTLREDLAQLIQHGRANQLYTNLITSGIGATARKLQEYVDAGLDHIQLSFQDSRAEPANEFAGTRAHAVKIETARMIRELDLAFTVNLVIHRENISRLEEMIEFAVNLGADRLEIAHVQYYGWAFQNRARLLPTQEQMKKSMEMIRQTQERLKGQIRIEYATPDYFAKYPKPCMGGWGSTAIVIDPRGRALPCHAAGVIPGLVFDGVRDHTLEWIWNHSEAFKRFRGDQWMGEPCVSCERKNKDFGGCRCQAFLVTGDASATDPVCSLAPSRALVDRVIGSQAETSPWVYR